ncbi:hypothetical protein H072_480 [Dactylellina haptotyla CBS 200.50]|uniref:Uncharacterized protein n=1 Tax=Dactylellina haptotyla (strain CBS 200.50) TaxID=1284197 RepID=S8AX00_DACHA|nr:hypothetical protein H072_480 [Dactylellina haptotyla CBS 200.50]
MKASLIVTLFAATAAAAPGYSYYTTKRCGGKWKKSCSRGESCIGGEILHDVMGVCVRTPAGCTTPGDPKAKGCSSGQKYYCVANPYVKCSGRDYYCKRGSCLAGAIADKIGVKPKKPAPTIIYVPFVTIAGLKSTTTTTTEDQVEPTTGESTKSIAMGTMAAPKSTTTEDQVDLATDEFTVAATKATTTTVDKKEVAPTEESTSKVESATGSAKAAVTTDPPVRTCGGPSNDKCEDGEDCLGKEILKDGMGICIKSPNYCAGAFNVQCPTTERYYCVNNPDRNARRPPNVADWAGNGCLPAEIAEEIGFIEGKDPRTGRRCMNKAGDKCYEGETCAGTNAFSDEKGGVCVKGLLFTCTSADTTCKEGYTCALNTDTDGVCIPKDTFNQLPTKENDTLERCDGGEKGCSGGNKMLCVGRKSLSNGMGVCIGTPASKCDKVADCSGDGFCVFNPDGSGACIPMGVAHKAGASMEGLFPDKMEVKATVEDKGDGEDKMEDKDKKDGDKKDDNKDDADKKDGDKMEGDKTDGKSEDMDY